MPVGSAIGMRLALTPERSGWLTSLVKFGPTLVSWRYRTETCFAARADVERRTDDRRTLCAPDQLRSARCRKRVGEVGPREIAQPRPRRDLPPRINSDVLPQRDDQPQSSMTSALVMGRKSKIRRPVPWLFGTVTFEMLCESTFLTVPSGNFTASAWPS